MRAVSILFIIQYLYVEGWVFTSIDIPKEGIKFDNGQRIDDANDLAVKGDPLNPDMEARIALIYPGTKWCGPGDTARNYDDLGSEWRTDMCCRAHDYCFDTIPGGSVKYNLTNNAYYTRLHCSCDETFRTCLQEADSYTAESIGTVYFNLIGTQCFKKEFPIKNCIVRGGWLHKKCLEYSYNTEAEKAYQWFDVPNYRLKQKQLLFNLTDTRF